MEAINRVTRLSEIVGTRSNRQMCDVRLDSGCSSVLTGNSTTGQRETRQAVSEAIRHRATEPGSAGANLDLDLVNMESLADQRLELSLASDVKRERLSVTTFSQRVAVEPKSHQHTSACRRLLVL